MKRKFLPTLLWAYLLFAPFFLQSQYVTNGSASSLGGDCFQLTPNLFNQGGSVWYQNKITLNSNFSVQGDIYFGSSDGGADGIAFVLQPVCSGLGAAGGGLGFLGISPSVGVEFDTWQNGEFNDPSSDHIALMKNGSLNHGSGNNLQGPILLANIENNAWHTYDIQWNAGAQNLKVYLDGILRIDYTGDIVNTVFGGNDNVFWGFTGATGAARNTHSVCIDNVLFTEEGSFVATNPSCPFYNNGSINLNPAGGVGPFTFAWSNGATTEDINNLQQGNYSVTVTDNNGCKTIYTIVLTNIPDVDAPTITCPQNVVISNDAGECSAVWKPNTKQIVMYNPTGSRNSFGQIPPSGVMPGFIASTCFQTGYLINWGNANVWPVGQITNSASIVLSEYVQFGTAVPDNTYFSHVTYFKRSYLNNGATQASIRSTQDGFVSDIDVISVNPGGDQLLTFDLSSLSPTTGISFRIYFWGAPNSPNDWDDLVSTAFYPNGGLRVFVYDYASASDNCGRYDFSYTGIDPDCTYPVGETTITAIATDNAGNSASCAYTVTVNDDENPNAICQDISVDPDEDGNYAIDADAVNDGSTDNCAIESITVDPSSIPCFHDATEQIVTLTVTDIHGNSSMCTATVTLGGDADCDGVGDACDQCPGGNDQVDNNDDGFPDCAVFPGQENLIAAWKCGNNDEKVSVCHIPPGNWDARHTICISHNAVQAHLDHGCYVGPCDNASCDVEGLVVANDGNTHTRGEWDFEVFVSPNNAEANVVLLHLEEEAFIQVLDAMGKVISYKTIDPGTQEIVMPLDDNRLLNGVYIFSVQSEYLKLTKRVAITK